jgi:hypothetical protein
LDLCYRGKDEFFIETAPIEKNNQSISYKFMARPIQVKENGHIVTKIIQSDLVAFVETIEGYLVDIGTELHLNKLQDDDENPQVTTATTGDNGYGHDRW